MAIPLRSVAVIDPASLGEVKLLRDGEHCRYLGIQVSAVEAANTNWKSVRATSHAGSSGHSTKDRLRCQTRLAAYINSSNALYGANEMASRFDLGWARCRPSYPYLKAGLQFRIFKRIFPPWQRWQLDGWRRDRKEHGGPIGGIIRQGRQGADV
ncbi:hypothetical protein PsorP6_012731 [Peronosclerospora sorghi]|uniref:Uncharacterized protein n=1 Tax=Peronosclerospora sorghi TaxID=230839 RepID=A0ACC0WIU3_9STRA|nr:hypothetical protein PsorP6_012731 [Peronosclerospora sorghi]